MAKERINYHGRIVKRQLTNTRVNLTQNEFANTLTSEVYPVLYQRTTVMIDKALVVIQRDLGSTNKVWETVQCS